ncbi:MAG TPA: DUF1330 domain-containing protein [Verrucomicrobiae bacterium]|nr:DUF1330 domain-containing protein [Verrucomicrobiae bacterium]
MTYVVVTIKTIKDLAAFRDYAVRAEPIIARHGGKYVAVDKSPDVRQGEWPFVRTVIVAYPDYAAAQRWYTSPEYQEIIPIRMRAIDANIVMVRDPEEAQVDMDPRKSGA